MAGKHRDNPPVSTPIILGIVLVVILLIAGLMIFFSGGDQADKKASATSPAVTTLAPPTTVSTTTPAPTTTTEPVKTTVAPVTTTVAPTTTISPKKPVVTEASPSQDTSLTMQVINITNEHRKAIGCPTPLIVDESLMNQAQAHSNAQSSDDEMYHSDGPEGFRSWGENVAYGYLTAQAVMDAWLSSSGHRENIENCDYDYIGVGLAGERYYWTQMFGG